MNRGFALTIGFLAVLAPAMAHAQTNIDQGKPASQLFANACAECHKAPHALAKGKSAATVAEFLREHYTTGRDQAAALAVYVVSGRDTVASPAPGRRPSAATSAQKPPKPEERATANAKPHRPGDEPTSGGSMMNPIVVPNRRSGTTNRQRLRATAALQLRTRRKILQRLLMRRPRRRRRVHAPNRPLRRRRHRLLRRPLPRQYQRGSGHRIR